MPKPHVITRAQLEAAGSCRFDMFEASTMKQGDALVYPDGITDEEVRRIAWNDPVTLLFLVSRNLLPDIGMTKARTVIEEVHGKGSLLRLKEISQSRSSRVASNKERERVEK